MRIKRLSLLTVLFSFIFVFTFSLTVFARIEHNVIYSLDGKIQIERHIGLSKIDTAQAVKIEGDGELERSSSILLKEREVNVEETNNFTTAESALENLTVTSIIKLCSPSESVYSSTKYISGYRSTISREVAEQVWMIQVEAKSGELGELNQKFTAGKHPEYSFEIEQSAAVTDGKIKKYIDVRSLCSNEYLYENFSIIGKAKIKETFKLDVIPGWYKLF